MKGEGERGFPVCSRAGAGVDRPLRMGVDWVAGEPFRLFFPFGVAVGVYGVSLWPMLYAGWLSFHPGVPHARLMILGFIGAFVVGFLGTALPRMLSAPRMKPWEVVGVFALFCVAVYCEARGNVPDGDRFFLAALVLFGGVLGVRWILYRRGNPPVEFGIAMVGVVCAVAGLGWQVAISGGEAGAFGARLSALLLYQGFTVLPVLGIGRFMAPRFLEEGGGGGRPRRAWAVIGVAAAVLVSLGIEAAGYMRVASGVRLVAVGWYFWSETAVFSQGAGRGALAFALRVSVWSLVASYGFGVMWPELRIGVGHVAFVSGFGLMVLAVGARVVLGHSGNSGRFFERNRLMLWSVWLALLAMATRVSADYFPQIMVSHHNYAALLWAGVAVLWLIWVAPKLVVADPDED